MSEIDELEARVSAALARIGQAVETLGAQAATPPAADPEEVATLRAELAAEREARARLEETVQADRTRLAALQQDGDAQRAAFAELDASLQRLRRAAQQLRESNDALRAANARGLGDAATIDAGLRAELEALRAEREAETAEVRAILAVLGPLAEEALAAPPEATSAEQEAG
jgi:chromosome segregation ATPase